MIIREMSHTDCMTLLSTSQLARLACCKDNVPYVVPISYRYVSGYLLSFSRPGRKVQWMRENSRVCLQVDHFTDRHQWKCLVVEGAFQELTQTNDRESAWLILQQDNDWWEPGGLKPNAQRVEGALDPVYFKIEIKGVSGREAFRE